MTKFKMTGDTPQRRCTDCPEHSGVIAQLNAGSNCMERLESGMAELRNDFGDHINSSSKSTIALLVGILMCFLTGIIGIYVNSVHPKDRPSSQVEMTQLVKIMATAIKESKK